MIEVNRLRIELFAQFYTEERYYRYTDSQGKVTEGTFRNDEIFDVWTREMNEEPVIDPMTGEPTLDPMTGEPVMEQKELQEIFIPDFDIDITIISKKPDDRQYYTNIAFQLHQLGILTEQDLLYTLDEGKLPDSQEILQHMAEKNQVQALLQKIDMLPEQLKPSAIDIAGQSLDNMVEQMMGQMQQQAMQGQQPNMQGQQPNMQEQQMI